MKLSVNQPGFMAWPGYYDRIDCADLHVVLDDVQFEKNSMVNRNRIRTPTGWNWLTVPIHLRKHTSSTIRETRIANDHPWRRTHWKTISANYRRAPFFSEHEDWLHVLFRSDWTHILPLIERIDAQFMQELTIDTPIIKASEMNVEDSASARILSLCERLEARTYVSGPYGRNYLDLDAFQDRGIEVMIHEYEPPQYRQAFPGFEPAMSALDLLFNEGPSAKSTMMAGRRLTAADSTQVERSAS